MRGRGIRDVTKSIITSVKPLSALMRLMMLQRVCERVRTSQRGVSALIFSQSLQHEAKTSHLGVANA